MAPQSTLLGDFCSILFGTCVAVAVFAGLCLLRCLWHACSCPSPECLRGKRVLVTGASRGIGRALALELGRLGAHLTITARSVELLETVAEQCASAGAASVCCVPGAMECDEFVKELVAAALQRMGGLDMVVLNHVKPATIQPFDGNVLAMREHMDVNFFSYAALASAALPALDASDGRLVVLSSVSGKVAMPFLATYAASKFALDGFFSSLRSELAARGSGVSITLCVVGLVDTETARTEVRRVNMAGYMYSPAKCACDILNAAAARWREAVVCVPWASALLLKATLRWATDWLMLQSARTCAILKAN